MAGETRSFKLGKSVTVTAPEEITEQVAAAVSRMLGGPKGRARKAAPNERLSADRIVAVAVDQMREHGYDAVTMRSIARELGTGPASLYAHVANRAELDQLVVGWVCGQWQIPDPDPEHWDDQLRACLIDMLDLYRANPGVARCTLGMIPLQPSLLLVTERLIALLKAGKVSDQHCAWFVDVAALYVASVAVEEDIWRERHRGQDPDEAAAVQHQTEEAVVDEVRRVFQSLPAEHFPLLSAMAESMTTGSADDRFAFGVDLLVGGLKAKGGSKQ
ncbi:MAG: TetR/AcrR family transcriptional regulator C-terminal domain-containing protein [Propionibacteriales bacterium]|nr:TetR/AcrR family transcriptional regulator C-terminal domain-containing protein [Propionibacteriales bacterium]